MSQSSRFNPDPNRQYKSVSNNDAGLDGRYRAGAIAGLLMLALFVAVLVFPKKVNKPVELSIQPPTAAPANPSTLTPEIAGQPPMHKRIVQRRSPTVAYTNDAYGISFRYPRNYKLQETSPTSGDAKSVALEQTIGSDPTDVSLAVVQVPKSIYPGTNFSDGYFSVSANQHLTEEACQQSVMTNEDSVLRSTTVNGVQFHWTTNSGDDDETHSLWNSYAGFVNGTCYEIQLGLQKALNLKSNNVPVHEVNSARVISRLETILSSLKINPVGTPATEAPVRSSAATPSPSFPSITALNSEVMCPKCPGSVAQAYVVAGGTLEITGRGFLPSNTVTIGSTSMLAPVEKSPVEKDNKDNNEGSDRIRIAIPDSLAVGTYELYVANDSGKSDAVTVVVRPPTVQHVDAIAGQSSEPDQKADVAMNETSRQK